jgi:hypothetical protein
MFAESLGYEHVVRGGKLVARFAGGKPGGKLGSTGSDGQRWARKERETTTSCGGLSTSLS